MVRDTIILLSYFYLPDWNTWKPSIIFAEGILVPIILKKKKKNFYLKKFYFFSYKISKFFKSFYVKRNLYNKKQFRINIEEKMLIPIEKLKILTPDLLKWKPMSSGFYNFVAK